MGVHLGWLAHCKNVPLLDGLIHPEPALVVLVRFPARVFSHDGLHKPVSHSLGALDVVWIPGGVVEWHGFILSPAWVGAVHVSDVCQDTYG